MYIYYLYEKKMSLKIDICMKLRFIKNYDKILI